MNNKFDELTKSLAQSVTRRAAFKKLGVGLAGMALVCIGLASKAEAAKGGSGCLPSGTVCAGFLSDPKPCHKCCNGYRWAGVAVCL
jgi:hypothetical protein